MAIDRDRAAAALSSARTSVDPTIADLIASTDGGDPAAAEALFAALYRELHQLARRELARGGGQLSLGATTLLHEAYLDMSGRAGHRVPGSGPRFMGYAARVMRSLIVDHARRRRALKRGGAFEITALETGVDVAAAPVGRARRAQHGARRAGRRRSAAGPRRRPQVLLRLLVRRDRRDAGRSPTGPCSATGKRRASSCSARCGATELGRVSRMAAVHDVGFCRAASAIPGRRPDMTAWDAERWHAATGELDGCSAATPRSGRRRSRPAGRDPRLADDVAQLLRDHESAQAGGFLEQGPEALLTTTASPGASGPRPRPAAPLPAGHRLRRLPRPSRARAAAAWAWSTRPRRSRAGAGWR